MEKLPARRPWNAQTLDLLLIARSDLRSAQDKLIELQFTKVRAEKRADDAEAALKKQDRSAKRLADIIYLQNAVAKPSSDEEITVLDPDIEHTLFEKYFICTLANCMTVQRNHFHFWPEGTKMLYSACLGELIPPGSDTGTYVGCLIHKYTNCKI